MESKNERWKKAKKRRKKKYKKKSKLVPQNKKII